MAYVMPVGLSRDELARVAAANLLARPEYAYFLLRSHATSDPSVFLGYTYFGTITDGLPKIVSRRPVGWKGKKGIEAVRAVNPGVASGLEAAIKISKDAAGTTGVFGMKVGPNLFVIIPRKAIHQVALGKHAPSVGKALEAAGTIGANIVDVLTRLGTAPILVRPKTALGIPRAAVRRKR